ncbi:MAG: DNA-processing protein DprA [Verrucomicrobia bacterium]|nr:DNA-processing protein DprA [Verrucomicrobiota bacterium]
MTRTEAYLALNLLPKIGPVRVRRLLEVFETPERILTAKARELSKVNGFGEDLASAIATWETTIDLTRELRRIKEENLTILTQEDALYPKLLKQIHDPPIVLYVRGQLTERDHHGIAIVGSRHTTQYGLNVTKKLAFQIAYAGYTIVSGLARGIDTAAHEGALAGKGRTVAVIGAGIGKLYPPENAALAERIAEHGAVVSEFPVDYPPDKQSFPLRNRIVSGWSCGVILTEAPARSGALITAQQAVEQGRAVFAVPGGIDRPSSHGCNRLIQQGAKLIMDGADVLDDLMSLFPTQPNAPKMEAARPGATLTGDEAAVYAAIGTDETHVNEITSSSGLPSSTVNATLMKLEMKRVIKPLPGKYYVRLI